MLYVAPPDREARAEIFALETRRMPLHADVDLAALSEGTDRYSGAEIAGTMPAKCFFFRVVVFSQANLYLRVAW